MRETDMPDGCLQCPSCEFVWFPKAYREALERIEKLEDGLEELTMLRRKAAALDAVLDQDGRFLILDTQGKDCPPVSSLEAIEAAKEEK